MIEYQTILLFSVAVLALLLSPGPNMAFLLSHGISHGVKGGISVAIGIFLADLILTLVTAAGITAAITAWAPSFDLIRYLGIIYLLWLAFKNLQSGSVGKIEEQGSFNSWRVVRAALTNSLLNPKALLFFMVFLPQFVSPASEDVALQLLVLGGILSVIALIFHCALGLLSGKVAAVFFRRPTFAKHFGKLHALIFLALAIRLFLLERPIK